MSNFACKIIELCAYSIVITVGGVLTEMQIVVISPRPVFLRAMFAVTLISFHA